MSNFSRPGSADRISIPGPSGKPITIEDLPPADTKRWVVSRKMAVVAGVRAGVISLDEVCRRYRLSKDEFTSWQRLLDAYGLKGLRATRIQSYRPPRERHSPGLLPDQSKEVDFQDFR
ncbi:MAG TPA: DUF1153 domain-containing protein [Alphaproteobacteria bacterium]|nr:DUF1153 domain-containing protein [Alphaproteobacteria bacterium]